MDIREIMKWAGQQTCGRPFIEEYITIKWSNKMTLCLGKAIWNFTEKRGIITFSNPLWYRATEEQRREIVVHETCHIIKSFLYGRTKSIHGREWKQLMGSCGYFGKIRCHNVDRTGLRKTYKAYCNCQEHIISSNVRTKMLRGCKYRCTICKAVLQFEKLQRVEAY